jgi:glycosyltransferase involved in cell wall biosynthesis
MKKQNKFTIIIPTRDRAENLSTTIKSCLNQTYNNYEILISDNFSIDNTKEVVMSFKDSRISYINTEKRISMSENFDFALNHVQDGYLMFIGDDDAILPNSLEYVNEIINSTNTEAVMSYNAFYTWPGTPNPNKLFWSPREGYEVRDSKTWIKNYLRFNMEYTFDLPSVYCGFVKRSAFDRVKKGDSFFKSSTPDAYSAIAFALTTDFYVYSHTPFVIHGSSPKSNGGAYLGRPKGEEGEEVKLFFKENKIPFHKDIIMTKSFRICSIEAFLQFSDYFPEYTIGYKIDWQKLLKFVLTERKESTKEEIENAVKDMCKMHNLNFEDVINNIPKKFTGVPISEIMVRFLYKLKNTFQNKTIKIENTISYGVNNVYDAALLLNFFLKTRRNIKSGL